MTDDKRSKQPRKGKPGKSIGDMVEKLWQDVIDTLGDLVTPEPVPIPVPIRNPHRR